MGAAEEALMAGLISSPGYGVIDSGCGKTLIGADTLREMQPKLMVEPCRWSSSRIRSGSETEPLRRPASQFTSKA